MNLSNTRYIDLTFINDSEEIKKQIRNTVLFLYLAEKYTLSILSDYLEDTQYGYTASAQKDGKFKLLRITDITEGKVDWKSVPFCVCDKPTKYLLHQNDILVARTGGTTGKSFIVKDLPSNVVYASYLIRLRVKKETNPEFISAFLNSYTYWSQLVELKRGAAQPNVNAEKLKKIVIPNCPSEIQDKYISFLKGEMKDELLENRINKILSLFDGNQLIKTEHTHQLNLLKKLRQQILQDAVQGKLVPQDPNDEPATKLLERVKAEKEKLIREKKIKKEKQLPEIKPEEIPFEIPENWVWCRLGEIASIVRGGSPRPAGDKRYYDGSIPFLKVADLTANEDIYLKKHTYTIKEAGLYKTRYVDSDTLMLTNSGATLGVPKICTFPTTFNDGIAAFLGLNNIEKIFLYHFLKSRTEWYLKEASRGQGQPNLNTDIISLTVFALPPLNEQNRIIVKIKQIMQLCDELEQTILQNQKYTQELLLVALKEALEPKA